MLLNGLIVLMLVGSLYYIQSQLGEATKIIEEQGIMINQLQTVSNAGAVFSKMRYWMTDLAASWQNEAENNAMAAKAELEKMLQTMQKSNPKVVASVTKNLEAFSTAMMSSVDAYIDENRVLGNSLVSKGRESGEAISQSLNKLMVFAKKAADEAGSKVKDANSAIQSLCFILILMGVVVGLTISILFSRSLTASLKSLIAAMGGIAEGDLKQEKLPVESTDEIGTLRLTYNNMLEFMQNIGLKAGDISAGKLDTKYDLKGDLAIAFDKMTDDLIEKRVGEERE